MYIKLEHLVIKSKFNIMFLHQQDMPFLSIFIINYDKK